MIIVFLVAGLSSRFGGNPKPLARVGPDNQTLIEYSVAQALTCNFTRIIFITNPKTESSFVKIFGSLYKGIRVEYYQQKYDKNRSRPWGTTDAVCVLHGKICEPFILVNGDDIYGISTFKNGFKLLQNPNENIIGGCRLLDTLPKDGYVNRGVIKTDGNYVTSMKEYLRISKIDNPELHNELANVNFIGLQILVLGELKEILDRFKEEHKEDRSIECLLPDSLNELVERNRIKFFVITEQIVGLTHPNDELIMRKLLQK